MAGQEQPEPKRRRRRRRRGKKTPSSGATSATAGRTEATKASPKGEPKAKASSRAEPKPKPKPSRERESKAARKAKPARRRPRHPTVREVSAGGVVYRRDGDEIEILLAARRTRRGQLAWGLAKGGIEEGETPEEAAIREVLEETGIEAEIETSLGETKYMYVWEDVRIRKTVHFFLMRATGGDPADHDDEMEDVRWFPKARAFKRASYRGERDMLHRAADLIR
jgi:8-oxo-dGTP pyrophosphatase MutT (NUDIX family)